MGGPPCQGFSNLGTRNPDDPRNLLWREYARVVRLAPDRACSCWRTCPSSSSPISTGCLVDWSENGPLRGYELTAGVLNAADYGVAQRRRRAIVVGSRRGQPTLPPPSHGKDDPSAPWATVRDAFAGIPFETGPTVLPARLESGVAGPFKVPELHLSRRPRELSLRRYELIPPGGGRFDLPDHLLPNCWKNKPTGTVDVMGRMEWDKPSLTIRTEFFKPEKGRYLHPQWDTHDPHKQVNRSISHWEAARLQSFPDDFAWCGSKIEIAKQIGNAVPSASGRSRRPPPHRHGVGTNVNDTVPQPILALFGRRTIDGTCPTLPTEAVPSA